MALRVMNYLLFRDDLYKVITDTEGHELFAI